MNGLSAETTEKQLAEMGVKSYKGQHFGNTSIRQILGNITYTGNLLFQKEYVQDPISKKSKINRGELPQYFVKNTHEAIIPMEVYQAVQTEKARRRELGALANWSINTSCFTSKIKCGRCGKSYQRSNRKGRKDPDANYTIWVCGTRRKTGNAKCQNKDIPEQILKEACAVVMGLDTFDEIIFSEQIDRIEIPAPNEMIFYFKDGHIVPHHWESTMRKDCWTDERRAAKGRYHVFEVEQAPDKETYKYYSTQRPIDMGTYPKSYFNRPVHMDIYFNRQQVQGEAFQAWGAITYAQPLTEQEMRDYELRPSRENLDIRRQMDAQAQVVGKWEDAHHAPEQKRLTWFYPDFGSYVVKEYVTPEQLSIRARGVERQAAAKAHKQEKGKQPIAEQLKAAQREAQEHQGPEAPKKKAPDRGER